MTQRQKIQLFEDKKVRTAWDDQEEKWYFSIVDVCGVLTEQPDYDGAKNYWKVLKFRLKEEGNESVTKCNQLKMVSPKDGKRYNTDVADTEQLFRLIQSIPSKKAELQQAYRCFHLYRQPDANGRRTPRCLASGNRQREMKTARRRKEMPISSLRPYFRTLFLGLTDSKDKL